LFGIEDLKKLIPENKNKIVIWNLTLDEVEKDAETIKDDLECLDYSIVFKPLIQVDSMPTVVPNTLVKNKIKMIPGHTQQPNVSIELFYGKLATERILQIVSDFLVKKFNLEAADCYWFRDGDQFKQYGIVFQIVAGEAYLKIIKRMCNSTDTIEIDDNDYSFCIIR